MELIIIVGCYSITFYVIPIVTCITLESLITVGYISRAGPTWIFGMRVIFSWFNKVMNGQDMRAGIVRIFPMTSTRVDPSMWWLLIRPCGGECLDLKLGEKQLKPAYQMDQTY